MIPEKNKVKATRLSKALKKNLLRRKNVAKQHPANTTNDHKSGNPDETIK